MTDFQPGGRRRLDRVLDPQLLDSLPSAEDDALRVAAGDAQQEEAELSYVRRLLQGRLDQVRAELDRRAGTASAGGAGVRTDDELVEMLTSILGEPRADGGSGRYVDAEADHDGERRRTAELAAADVRLSDPSALDDAALEAARERLAGLEVRVSSMRHDVQVVVDAVSAELARRDGTGESASA